MACLAYHPNKVLHRGMVYSRQELIGEKGKLLRDLSQLNKKLETEDDVGPAGNASPSVAGESDIAKTQR